MAQPEDNPFSLRGHLINWLLTPLFVLWLFSTIAGYVATLSYANKPYDMVLLQRAQAIGIQLGLNGGKARPRAKLELPDGSTPSQPDKLFYTVSDKDGNKLAGNANLHRPLSLRNGKIGPLFGNGERDGVKTRTLNLLFFNPDNQTLYQLHLAETMHQRQALIRGILANIVIPQLLLILVAVAAVWFALNHGLAPLERLRRDVANRSRNDLHPLDATQTPDEVRPLIAAVNDLLQRLQEVMQAQQRFVADAAHQLRTPFAGLKTQSELALRETDPSRVEEALHHIHASTKHGARLVNQLLTLARNEPGGQALPPLAPLDLNALAQECTTEWVPLALEKNIDLGFAASPNTPIILGHAASLVELFNNLLDNAVRYTPVGGHITAGIAVCQGGVELYVEDNGPGILPEHRERVFERFYRVLGSGQSGSGIGLAIVAEIAKRHGAALTIEDGAEGKGTRFRVHFRQSARPVFLKGSVD